MLTITPAIEGAGPSTLQFRSIRFLPLRNPFVDIPLGNRTHRLTQVLDKRHAPERRREAAFLKHVSVNFDRRVFPLGHRVVQQERSHYPFLHNQGL